MKFNTSCQPEFSDFPTQLRKLRSPPNPLCTQKPIGEESEIARDEDTAAKSSNDFFGIGFLWAYIVAARHESRVPLELGIVLLSRWHGCPT